MTWKEEAHFPKEGDVGSHLLSEALLHAQCDAGLAGALGGSRVSRLGMHF